MNAIERAIIRSGPRIAQLDRHRGGRAALITAIDHVLPRLFDADAAGELDAIFALEIRGPRTVFRTLTVRDRRLTITRGRPHAPQATVTIGADDIVRLATGDTGWPALLAGGRLELAGDPFLALRFPRLFALPAAAGKPVSLRRKS
jgi:hypothetical protein